MDATNITVARGGWRSLLTYQEVFRRRPPRAELDRLIASMPQMAVFDATAGISAIAFHDGGVEQPGHQRPLVEALVGQCSYRRQLLRELEAPHRILFTRECLMAMCRLAVVLNSNGDGGNFGDSFIRAALAVNEHLSDELNPPSLTGNAADLLRSELRSILSQTENPHDLLARMEKLFLWSVSDEARRLESYLPIEEDLIRFTGLGHRDLAAATYAFLSRSTGMRTWADVERDHMVFNFEAWIRHCANPAPLRTWLSTCRSGITAMREEWRQEASLSLAGLGSFWARPVLDFENDAILIPSTDLLNNNLDAGLFFTFFDAYGRNDGNAAKLKFSAFFGRFFEHYIGDLFSTACEGTQCTVRREEPYGDGSLSTDVVVVEPEHIIFVEIVSKRLNLVKSILRFDQDTIDADVEAGILHKLEQLSANIQAYKDKVLFPDLPRPKGQLIFPVLVMPTAWPRISVLTGRIPELEAAHASLRAAEPVEFLDVGEVEQLQEPISRGCCSRAYCFRRIVATGSRALCQ